MKIGDRIKKVRAEKIHMSQVDLAKAIGVSKQTLYKYENNIVTNIPTDKIEAIARLANVAPAYLMGWTDDPRIPVEDRVQQWREANPVPEGEQNFALNDIYLNFAKEAQADGIDPDDIRAVLDILKKAQRK